MADYISRKAAIEEACHGCSFEFSDEPCEPCDCEIMARLNAIPAADVVPVVRAKWENRFNFYLKCSNCHKPYAVSDGFGCKQSRNFCPHCGARMDGDANG